MANAFVKGGGRLRLSLICLCLASVSPMLSGCQRGAEIGVSGDPVAPTFNLSWPSLAERILSGPFCARAIWVRPMDDYDPYARIGEVEAESCTEVSEYKYGVAPSGFVARGEAPLLEVGASYVVEVSGPGIMGSTSFRVEADGVVIR